MKKEILVFLLLLFLVFFLSCMSLIDAIKANDEKAIADKLKDKKDLDAKDDNGNTPLLIATAMGNAQVVAALCDAGVALDLVNNNGESALLLAVRDENLEITQILVDAGADVNKADKKNNSPLSVAVDKNNIDIARILVDKGANTNVKNFMGIPVLLNAVSNNRGDLGDLLIAAGADVDINDSEGTTVLMKAALFDIIGIVKKVAVKVKNINATDKNGETALFYAVIGGSMQSLEIILSCGADWKIATNEGETILSKLINDLRFEKAYEYYKRGIDFTNVAKQTMSSVIITLIENGQIQFLGDLLVKGLKTSYELDNGETMLYVACRSDNASMVELLLGKGADPNIKTKDGDSVIDVVIDGGDKTILGLLFKYGLKVDWDSDLSVKYLRKTISNPDIAMSIILVMNGADPTVRVNSPVEVWVQMPSVPFYVAAILKKEWQADIVGFYEKVLKNNFPYSVTYQGIEFSPLFFACYADNLALVKYLTTHGQKIVTKTITGITPLHFAAVAAHEDLVSYLVENGADIMAIVSSESKIQFSTNYKEKDTLTDKTPFQWALEFSNKDAVTVLIKKETLDYTTLKEDGFQSYFIKYSDVSLYDQQLKLVDSNRAFANNLVKGLLNNVTLYTLMMTSGSGSDKLAKLLFRVSYIATECACMLERLGDETCLNAVFANKYMCGYGICSYALLGSLADNKMVEVQRLKKLMKGFVNNGVKYSRELFNEFIKSAEKETEAQWKEREYYLCALIALGFSEIGDKTFFEMLTKTTGIDWLVKLTG